MDTEGDFMEPVNVFIPVKNFTLWLANCMETVQLEARMEETYA